MDDQRQGNHDNEMTYNDVISGLVNQKDPGWYLYSEILSSLLSTVRAFTERYGNSGIF